MPPVGGTSHFVCAEGGISSARSAVLADPVGGRQTKEQKRCTSCIVFHSRPLLPEQARSPLPVMKNAPLTGCTSALLFAERAGFEPAIPFRVYTLSRRAPSTTRTPLLKGCKSTISPPRFRIFFVHFVSSPRPRPRPKYP
jgi:hypothetical protein